MLKNSSYAQMVNKLWTPAHIAISRVSVTCIISHEISSIWIW